MTKLTNRDKSEIHSRIMESHIIDEDFHEDRYKSEKRFLIEKILRYYVKPQMFDLDEVSKIVSEHAYRWKRFYEGAIVAFEYSSKKNVTQRRMIQRLTRAGADYFDLYRCIYPKISHKRYLYNRSENEIKVRNRIQSLNRLIKPHGFRISIKNGRFNLIKFNLNNP